MKDYLLFIDTEASGLPKNWSLPYDAPNNWPYCVQISWVIYTNSRSLVKEENHYIKNDDFEIDESAVKIHGITRDYLKAHGQYRKDVLRLLLSDFEKYAPLVIGHFMQFDAHMLNADFYREGMENRIKKANSFCTMLGSTHLIKNPSVKYLRLEQLYQTLFQKKLENPHDALVDAKATALCFFTLLQRKEIDEDAIEKQQKEESKKEPSPQKFGCYIPVLVIFCLTILIFYCL